MTSEHPYTTHLTDKKRKTYQHISSIKTGEKLLQFISHNLRNHNFHKTRLTVLLDLDGTLIDTFPRQLAILRDQLMPRFPNLPWPQIKRELQNQKQPPYSILGIIQGYIDDSAVSDEIQQTFLKYFLSDCYLHHDGLIPKAKEFVTMLHNLGVGIVFLTGRPEPEMRQGTVQMIQQLGLHVKLDTPELVMKPNFEENDLTFKVKYMQQQLSKHKKHRYIFIDNEGSTCNKIKLLFPNVFVWHYLSTQSNNDMFNGPKLIRW